MCGRYAVTLPPEAIRKLFQYREQPNFPPRFNIAPTQPIPIVREEGEPTGRSRHFVLVRWGFWPAFVKDPKTFPLIINARREDLTVRASFQNAIRRRRCLIPADGFYEWQRLGPTRRDGARPFLLRRTDRQPFAFAGLWDTWTGPNGEEVETACIITTEASGLFAAIHARRPVIIPPQNFDVWLDRDTEGGPPIDRLLDGEPDPAFEAVPIGPAINKAANDGPEVQEPIGPPTAPETARGKQRSFDF